MNRRTLFILTSYIEILAGFALIILPSSSFQILLGTPVLNEAEYTISRIAGIALISLGVACGMARNDNQSRASRALISGMLVYNIAVISILAYSGIVQKTTVVLILALITHLILAVACFYTLQKKAERV